MRTFYRECHLLLCTSESEGFPNVFLEAWSCGKAVLTSVDPDQIVATFGLGRVTTDYAEMRTCLASLVSEQAWWREAGLRGPSYVEEHHSAKATADALERVIERCCTPLAKRAEA